MTQGTSAPAVPPTPLSWEVSWACVDCPSHGRGATVEAATRDALAHRRYTHGDPAIPAIPVTADRSGT